MKTEEPDELDIPCPHHNCDYIIHIKHVKELKKYIEVSSSAFYVCDGCAQSIKLRLDNDNNLTPYSIDMYDFPHSRIKINEAYPADLSMKAITMHKLCSVLLDIKKLTGIDIANYAYDTQDDCKNFYLTIITNYTNHTIYKKDFKDQSMISKIECEYKQECYELFKNHVEKIGKIPMSFINKDGGYDVPDSYLFKLQSMKEKKRRETL